MMRDLPSVHGDVRWACVLYSRALFDVAQHIRALCTRSLTCFHLQCFSIFPLNVLGTPAEVDAIHVRSAGKIEPAWTRNPLIENSRCEYVVLRRKPHLVRCARMHGCTGFQDFMDVVGLLHGKHRILRHGYSKSEFPSKGCPSQHHQGDQLASPCFVTCITLVHPMSRLCVPLPVWICNSIRGRSFGIKP